MLVNREKRTRDKELGRVFLHLCCNNKIFKMAIYKEQKLACHRPGGWDVPNKMSAGLVVW
jgi:hypothetical protein